MAIRWLDRAHRLVPDDTTIALTLATACLGQDDRRAAGLFHEILAAHDVREGWLGLAHARLRLGDHAGAADALGHALGHHALGRHALGRHAWAAGVATLAETVVLAGGLPGWCGLSGSGVPMVNPAPGVAVEIALDGRPVRQTPRRIGWTRARTITVTAGGRHLLGSPIDVAAIGRLTGRIEAEDGGIRGWASHPNDPDTAAVLTVLDATGHPVRRRVATGETGSFQVPAARLAGERAPFRVVGRDGADLEGSPLDPSALTGLRASIGPSQAADTLVAQQRRRDLARWRAASLPGQRSVILIAHADGGGVEQRVIAAAARYRADGLRPIVLRPADSPDSVIAGDGPEGGFPSLRYAVPDELPALLRFLRTTHPAWLEFHHMLGHHPGLYDLPRRLGVPYDAHIHDYAWICPRIALMGSANRYCGEPELAACETCIAQNGSLTGENIGVGALRRRSASFLTRARDAIAPSRDAATRMRRYFPDLPVSVVPHGDDSALPCLVRPTQSSGVVLVCVAGGIGPHKGYDVLLACARDAAQRSLPLQFIVVGDTTGDAELLATGHVFITGTYHQREAVDLIRAQNAHLGFVPSVWPESWSLTLGELWHAGLRVAAFDLGAPAERIRATGRGFLLPFGLPPASVCDALLAAGRGFGHE